MVGFFVFVVAVIAVLGLNSVARRTEDRARNMAAATAVARELLNTQRAKGYSALANGTTRGQTTLTTERRGNPGRLELQHSLVIKDGPVAGTKSILATVSWREAPAGSVEVETYVGN